MATNDERIHDRIDHLVESVNTLTQEVRAYNAKCDICRPIVLGNGKGSLDSRVTTLEVEGKTDRKWIAFIAAGAASVISTIGAIVVQFFTKPSSP